jgi:hypothetical protein
MSGKPGQQSEKATDLSGRYDPNLELDGRSFVARTLRDRLRALTNDQGGAKNLSYQRLSLNKRAIHVERLIEKTFEVPLANGQPVDVNAYLAAINSLSNLYSKIGLERKSKLLSLGDYLTGKQNLEPGQTIPGATTTKEGERD